ncbi:MAG: TonB-dependent receptor [Bryobacterales bacterium]|nr:TonB-dependent receptor [Bryobacterales bacterium]
MYFRSFVLVVLGSLALLGQSTLATLTGVVLDEQNASVSGATVTLKDPVRGLVRETLTNDSGYFTLPQLAPSNYELTVAKPGFRAERVESLVLNAKDQRTLRLQLAIAAQSDAVNVVGELPLVSLAPAVATAVDRGFIENQPLNGRSFQTLINLSPGVVLTNSSIVNNGQFSVNGQRTAANYFTVDGVSANFGMVFATTPYEGASGSIPSFSALGGTNTLASVDAVQEFTIQTSTYAPEYGRQPGGQVAIVTRSGTNELHGVLFNYLRNDKLDANSWFGNRNRLPRAALRQNNYGFTLGGPVFVPKFYDGRNRTFFFVSHEGLRLVQPVISRPLRVPTVEARAQATGILRNLLEAYPLPTGPAFADAPLEAPFLASFSNPSTLDATSVRLDHAFNDRVTLFGRYNYAPSESRERARYAAASFVAVLPALTETATVGATAVLSPAVNNDFRVNWSRSRAGQIYQQDTFGGAKLLPENILIPGYAAGPTALLYLQVDPNDDNTLSPGTFSLNSQQQWNFVNTTNWTTGAHAWKFGADYRRLAPNIGGRLYGKTLTFTSITNLITGIVPTGSVTEVDRFLEPRYDNFSAFVQDAWRIAPRLTLTYGARWEVNPAPGDAGGDPPLTVRGLDTPQTATLDPAGTRLYDTTWGNVAPRVGVAWQPFNSLATVIRAGFGVFYDLGNAFAGTAQSPGFFPNSRQRVLPNTSIEDPLFFEPVPPVSMQPPYPRLFAFEEGYQLPRTRQYSLAVEQPLGAANSLSISYVGAAGRMLARVESLRPSVLQNPAFTRIDYVTNAAFSDYDALQVQFKRRMTRNFQALLAYTWGKSLDTASDESISNFQTPVLRSDPRADRGPSEFDIRHAFTGSATWELPALGNSRFLQSVTGGFAFDSVVRFTSALPVNIISGRDVLGLGLTNVSRPDLVPGQPLYIESDTLPGGWRINPAAFDAATPLAQARQGTLGRNVVRGFGLSQVDLALRRRFAITDTIALSFRAEAFNLANTTNFANPTGVLTSPNFGVSTQIRSVGAVSGPNPLFQVGGPRSIQLALRLEF